MQQREEVQVEGGEHEEGELPQEGPPNTSNENYESTSNNNNNIDANAGEVSETTSTEIQQQSDRPLCRYFARGFCRYGENCRFSHDDQLQQNGQGQGPEYQNGAGKLGVLTHPRSPTPCRFFAKGYCRYGDDCKFSHNVNNNNNRFQNNGLVIPNGGIVHHPHPPPHPTYYQQQPYSDWSNPQDGDDNIKPWDEDSQEPMHQTPYY
jgi:hypothetical protein